MKDQIIGKAIILGNDVNSDILHPSRYFSLDKKTRASGFLANNPKNEAAGTIILAGRNFGVGSSRESVVRGIKEAGVLAIAAQSVSRIFLRNAVNNGLPVFCGLRTIEGVRDNDLLILDQKENRLICQARSLSAAFDPLDDYLNAVLEAGGLLNYLDMRW